MRLAAILGIIIFGGLAYLFLKMGIADYKREEEGETLVNPAWTSYMGFLILLIFTILCIIYALGLWDAFVEFSGFNESEPVITRQF